MTAFDAELLPIYQLEEAHADSLRGGSKQLQVNSVSISSSIFIIVIVVIIIISSRFIIIGDCSQIMPAKLGGLDTPNLLVLNWQTPLHPFVSVCHHLTSPSP